MLDRIYDGQVCSIARTLELVGDRWTLLVIRDVFAGVRRFDDLQRSLGCPRTMLAGRLGRLVDDRILERHCYQERPARFEYRLTDRGRDLWPVLMTLMTWGDRHAPLPDGPPVRVNHHDCGGELDQFLRCDRCRRPVTLSSSQPTHRPALAVSPG